MIDKSEQNSGSICRVHGHYLEAYNICDCYIECEHDMVKLLTKDHGDVWVCLKCKSNSKPEVFTDEELDVMVEFCKSLRKKDG